jgi:CHAD domain-containing protein
MNAIAPRLPGQPAKPAAVPWSAPSAPDCQAAFQSIARNCVVLLRNHRKAAMAADADAIHTMRIELTRFRAAVLFFSTMTDDDAWPGIDRELRWLNSALGKARNHDVTAHYARRKRYRRWAKSSWRAMLRAQRRVDRRLTRKLASDRCLRLIAAVDHWIADGPWLKAGRSIRSGRLDAYAQAQLRAWRAAISREGRHIRALHRKRLHRLRIRCKRYRYVVAALRSLGVTIARQDMKFAEIAKRAHGTLGELRDLRRLRRAAQKRPPGYRKSKRKLLHVSEELFRRGAATGVSR